MYSPEFPGTQADLILIPLTQSRHGLPPDGVYASLYTRLSLTRTLHPGANPLKIISRVQSLFGQWLGKMAIQIADGISTLYVSR